MNRLLVFGASGFVGPYLGKEFKSHGYVVFGTDVKNASESSVFDGYYQCDILDKKQVAFLIKTIRPTHIVNLAAISSVAQSWKMPGLTMQVNVNGTLNVFEACLSLGIKPRILLIGSSEEYVPCNHPIDENVPLNANNPYGISKIAQEQFAKIYRERFEWPIFCVRSFNHIGPGQSQSFVISSWCKQIADIEKGIAKPLMYVGNLEVCRDFTDVRDVVSAYRLVIESEDANLVYNIGSGEANNLKDVLEMLINMSRKNVEIAVDPRLLRANDNHVITCDCTRIKTKLGWKPIHQVNETIRDIYNCYLKGFSS